MSKLNFAPLAVLGFGFGGVLLGCGGDDGGTSPPATSIAKASTSSGDQQSGTVGQPLLSQLRVLVTQDGAPAPGVNVTWSTQAAGGLLDPLTSATASDGIATTLWTLGTVAGAQTAQASLSGASGSPVSFSATATPDAAATLSEFGGDQQSAQINTQLPAPVQAKVSDQFGNGVAGVDVGWSATGGTVSAVTVPTDAAGVSGVTVIAGGTEGPITIVATSGPLTGSPLTFTATATPVETQPPNVSVLNDRFEPATLTIDAGTEVVWTWGPGAVQHNVTPVGTLPPRSGDPTDAPATYRFTFDTPGTYAYYCQVHGSPTFGMRGTIIVQ